MIGIMQQKGLGVKKNLSEAYYWLKVSLDNGYKLSTDVLVEISHYITHTIGKENRCCKICRIQKTKGKDALIVD